MLVVRPVSVQPLSLRWRLAAPLVGEPLAEDLFFAIIADAPKPMPAAGQTGAKRQPPKTRWYAKASPTRRGGIEQSEDDGEVVRRKAFRKIKILYEIEGQ